MRSLSCRRCGTVLTWDGSGAVVRCHICGAQYRVHPKGDASRGATVGTGDVAPIRTTQGQFTGIPLVKSFTPKGWKLSTNAPECEMNRLVPLTPSVEYLSPDQGACITYTGTRAYNHLEPTPQNAQMQGRMAMPDRMIGLAYRDAAAICDGMVRDNPNVADARLLSAFDRPDAWASNVLQKVIREFAQAGALNPGGNWSKKYYTVVDRSGNTWHKLVEALVAYLYLPVTPQEQQMYQLLLRTRVGGFGGLFGNQVPPPQPKLRWSVNYVVETSALERNFPEAMQYHDKIRNSFETLTAFAQARDHIQDMLTMQTVQDNNVISNSLSQMNRDRMASWDRKRRIMQDASDYGTQVMREMRESTAQTNQRVANLRSEAIRGVNTYYTNNTGWNEPRVVEASTRWDHVYQNQRHPDVYAASTGEAPLEFGVDFEELDRTNGDY